MSDAIGEILEHGYDIHSPAYAAHRAAGPVRITMRQAALHIDDHQVSADPDRAYMAGRVRLYGEIVGVYVRRHRTMPASVVGPLTRDAILAVVSHEICHPWYRGPDDGERSILMDVARLGACGVLVRYRVHHGPRPERGIIDWFGDLGQAAGPGRDMIVTGGGRVAVGRLGTTHEPPPLLTVIADYVTVVTVTQYGNDWWVTAPSLASV